MAMQPMQPMQPAFVMGALPPEAAYGGLQQGVHPEWAQVSGKGEGLHEQGKRRSRCKPSPSSWGRQRRVVGGGAVERRPCRRAAAG